MSTPRRAESGLRELDALIAKRQQPLMVVSGMGTAPTSRVILQWQEDNAVARHDIAPGKPMQNGFVESLTTGSTMYAPTDPCSAH